MAATTESEESPVTVGKKEKAGSSQSSDNKEMESVRKSTRIKKPKKPASLLVQVQKKNLRRARSSSPESEEKEKEEKKKQKPASPTKITKKRLKKEASSEEEENEEENEEKSEEDSEDEGSNESFNLGMLNLRRVGDDSRPKEKSSVQLNARGMPRRICKKNPLFFDDDVVNAPLKTNKMKKLLNSDKKQIPKIKEKRDKRKEDVPKQITPEMSKEANTVRQRIGMKLRNLLKLPKAQRWVYYEWFYSNIDHVLFFGNNDFLLCAREAFSKLKTNMLTRMQWSYVRRVLGKPRRCSQNFFLEERKTLHKRRETIRKIQQRSIRDVAQCKELPDKVPLQLRVNSRVSALLRRPQAGLFTGKVDAVDPSNNTYRITFDRVGLGTHSIPDYEVLFHGEPDMVSISGMHKRYVSHKSLTQSMKSIRYDGGEPRESWEENIAMMGGPFSKEFYEIMVRICKILKVKREKVDTLKTMNTEAEKIVSLGEDFSIEFQKRYASVVVELESINISLNRYLTVVQRNCHECAPEMSRSAMLAPSFIREKSLVDSKSIVNNYFKNKAPLKNKKLADLVTELVALVLQLQTLSPNQTRAHERQVLKLTIARIKSMISPTNLLAFQNSVEVHLQYIEAKVATGTHLSPLLTTAK